MMPFPKTIAEQITLLGGKVSKIEYRGKHVRIHYMFGAYPFIMPCSKSPSDHRSRLNILGYVKRAKRNAELAVPTQLPRNASP